MCNKNTNKIMLFRTIVAFVLAAVMITALFLPIFKVGTYDVQTSDEYIEGSFTKYAEPVGEIDIGLFTFINIGLNFKDIYDIIKIQSLESQLQYLSNEAMTLYSEMSTMEEGAEKEALKAEIDAIVEKGNKVNDKIQSENANFDEARSFEISEKLKDKKFCEALVISYLVAENITDTFVEKDTSLEKAMFATNTTAIIEILLISAIMICIACFIISFVIAFIIKLLKFVIKLAAKKCDEDYYSKSGDFTFVSCALTFFALFLLWSIVSSLEISIGLGLIIMLAVATLGAVSLTMFRALLNNKNIVDTLLNVTVCLVAVFLAIFLSFSLLKVDAMYDYKKSYAEYSYVYFLEEVTVNDIETVEQMNTVLEQLGKINVRNTVVILSISVAIAVFFVSAISYFIKQLGRDGEKRAEGKPLVSRAGIVLCAVILAVSLLPSFFGTASVEKQYDSIEKGRYKILWHAYICDNTTTSIEYNKCLSTYTSLIHEIDALAEKIEIAEGETLAQYEKEYDEIVDYTLMIGCKLDRTRLDKKSGASVCMASAVALLVTQFIYTFIMYDNKKKQLVVAEVEAVEADELQAEQTEDEVHEDEVIEETVVENENSDTEEIKEEAIEETESAAQMERDE